MAQQEQKRFFAPKKFACTVLSETQGTVSFQEQVFLTKTIITPDYVYTSTGDSTQKWLGNRIDPKEILQQIERHMGIPSTQLKIKKNDAGVPNVFADEKQITSSFTKTHHGRFEAIEYTLN